DLTSEKVPFYQITVDEEMVNQQIERLQKGYGKKKDPEGGDEDENIEKAALDEELFKSAYPGKDIKSEEDLRAEIRKEIEEYWKTQSRNHLQHEIYHRLLEKSQIPFPEKFLKRW